MKCPYCQQENSDTYRFCRHCGQPRPAQAASGAGAPPPPAQPGQFLPVPPTQRAAEPEMYPPGGGQLASPSTLQAPIPGYPQAAPAQGYPPAGTPAGTPYTVQAQPYPPEPAYPQEQPASMGGIPLQTGQKKSSRARGIIIGVGALLILALIAGAVWLFLIPGGPLASGGSGMAIGVPLEDGGNDLVLLKSGDDIEDGYTLAEKIEPAANSFLVRSKQMPDRPLSNLVDNFGGFIPGSNKFLFWYLKDNDIPIMISTPGSDEADEILTTQSEDLSGVVTSGGKTLILDEPQAELIACYVSLSGDSADRLAEGDACVISSDESTLLIPELENEQLSMSLITTADGDDTSLVDGENASGTVRVSWNGEQAAYLQHEDSGWRVVILDTKEEDSIAESELHAQILNYAFAPWGNGLFYIAEDAEGNQQLFVLKDEEFLEVDTSSSLDVRFNNSGSQLVYLAGDEDGNLSLDSYNIKDEETEKIASSKDLSFAVLESPERILYRELDGTRLTLSSADVKGVDSLTLVDENDLELVGSLWEPGEDILFVLLRNTDGLISLYVSPIDAEDGYYLVEDWFELNLLNISPNQKHLVFSGREQEGDRLALHSINLEDGADAVELDDQLESAITAVFTSNSKKILYSARTGPEANQVEIRSVVADGEDSAYIEYEQAYLVGVQWASMNPFLSIPWRSTTGVSESIVSPAISCTRTVALSVGAAQMDNIGSGEKLCFTFPAEETRSYHVRVESIADLDPLLKILDEANNVVAEDDDSGAGLDPVANFTAQSSGTHSIQVEVKDDKTGDLRVTVREGKSDNSFDNAIPLPFDTTTRGAITDVNPVYIQSYDYRTHGNLYYFDGTAGQKIRIDVAAHSLGSELVPRVLVFDPNQAALKEDNVQVIGNQDYSFTYTLLTEGRHYILVQDNTDRFGSADKFYYDVLLSSQ